MHINRINEMFLTLFSPFFFNVFSSTSQDILCISLESSKFIIYEIQIARKDI